MQKSNNNNRVEMNGFSRVGTESVAGVITTPAERRFKKLRQVESSKTKHSDTGALTKKLF
jgi:hypothetical protein